MIHRTSPIRRWKQWLALPLVALLTFTVACEQNTEAVAPATRASAQNAETPPPPPPPPPVLTAESSPSSASNKLYTYVEEMPLFPTGNNDDLLRFLQSKVQYPAEAVQNKIEGKVFIAFTIGKDGKVKDASIRKGIGGGCDEAAIAAVQQLPNFTPGKQNGQPVNVRFTVPIEFALNATPKSN